MPNIVSVMKDEILRLARKEIRKEVAGLKKSSTQHRSDLADLKRRLTALEKQQTRLERKGAKAETAEADGEGTTRFRFSAKRFAAMRGKMGLSAVDMGSLIGVSAQTIYHWEAGKTRPRQSQLAAIASLRKLGKRAIKAQLANVEE